MLVTGATGLIGRAVCVRLGRDRRSVLGTHFRRDPPPAADGVRWVRVDLREPGTIEAMGELSAVIHLAAQLPDAGRNDERQAAATNRAIDENVIGAALARRVPVIYASGGSLYAGPPPVSGWGEQAATAPVGPYLQEKAWAEVRGMTLARESGAGFTALRINAPYGPEQRARTVMQIFVEQALAGGPVTYLGTGSREQDFTYEVDVADAGVAALDGPGGTFNVAGGEPVTMRRLAEMIAESAGLDRDAVLPAGRPDPQEGRRVAFDLRQSAQLLGWAPRVRLVDGISRCLSRRSRV